MDVPGAPEPGANVPPLLICVLPTVPVPLSTAPLFTVVRLELPLKPFTIRPPLLTTVVPVLGVVSGQGERAGSGLGERAAGSPAQSTVLQNTGEGRRQVVAADSQV